MRAQNSGRRSSSRWWAVTGGIVCAALLAGAVSSAWASEGGDDTGSAVVGAFGIGDGLEGTVDEAQGAFQLRVPVGPLQLLWDSRAAGSNEDGLGHGWSWALGRVGTKGGVFVQPPSSTTPYTTDATHPSGLAGYGGHDVAFEQTAGSLPPGPGAPEAGGPGGAEVPYAFVLHELGGTSTYFSAEGDPVASIDAFGARTTWVWDEGVPHRLLAVENPDGVRVALDWDREPGSVVVRPGANLGTTEGDGSGGVWRIGLDGGRVTSVTDAAGGRISVDYDDDSGLVTSVTGVSGGTTNVAWRTYDDGVTRVSRVATADPLGAEVSVREWTTEGDRLPSGWPSFDGGDLFWSGDPAYRYRTVLSDGATRVVSEYNSLHTLVERRMLASTPSGEHELQRLDFTYPGTEEQGVPDPAALPANWARPALTEVTYRSVTGQTRTTAEQIEYDAAGRAVTQTTAEGTSIAVDYWADGSRRSRATTAADGVVTETGFYWDGSRLVNDTHEGGEQTGVASYLIGTARHARTTTPDVGSGATVYFGTDRHNNVTDLTDHTGQVIARFGYTDYGTPTHRTDTQPGLDRNPFGYAGEYTDPEGTQHLGVRDYDPEFARFTTMDTEELHNLYAFGDLNPITKVDPTGRFSQDDLIHQVCVAGLAIAFTVLAALATWLNPGTGMLALGIASMVFNVLGGGAGGVSMANSLADEPFITDEPITEGMKWGEVALVAVGGLIAIGMLLRSALGFTARAAIQAYEMRVLKSTNMVPEFAAVPRASGSNEMIGKRDLWFAVVKGNPEVGQQSKVPLGTTLYWSQADAEQVANTAGAGHKVIGVRPTNKAGFTSVKVFSAGAESQAERPVDGVLRNVVGTRNGKLKLGSEAYDTTGPMTDPSVDPKAPRVAAKLGELDHAGQGVDLGVIMDGYRTRAILGRWEGIDLTVRTVY